MTCRLTDDYVDRYQDRLTPEQQRQLTQAARQARREMTTLVRAIKKASAGILPPPGRSPIDNISGQPRWLMGGSTTFAPRWSRS